MWAWATTEPRLHEPRGVIWWREVGISVISSYHSVRSVIPTTDHNTWIEIVKNQHHYIISYFDWDPSGFGCRSIDHSVRPTNWKGIQGMWRDCTTIYQWHETKVTSLSLWTQIHWSKVNIWGVMWKFRVMWTPHPPPKTTVSTCVLWFGLSSSDLKDTGWSRVKRFPSGERPWKTSQGSFLLLVLAAGSAKTLGQRDMLY